MASPVSRGLCLSSGRKPAFCKGYLSLTPPYEGFFERRRPKFKLVKTKFNVENFICDFGTIISWNVSQPEIAKKVNKPPILAFKVIQGHWFRCQSKASIWLNHISHRLKIQRLIGQKSQNFLTPSYLAPSLGGSLLNFWKSFTDSETRVFHAANSEIWWF